MARCTDCGARLFPLFNRGRCGTCRAAKQAADEAQQRAEAEKRYRAILLVRDRLSARGFRSRVAYGLTRGALLGLGHFATVLLVVAVVLGDGPGEPGRNIKHVNWRYVFWWFVLTALGVGALLLAREVGALRSGALWALLVPPAVAAALGAHFGARRAGRREWGWWLDLDPPEHLANVNR